MRTWTFPVRHDTIDGACYNILIIHPVMATTTIVTATLLSLSLACVCLFLYLSIAFLAFEPHASVSSQHSPSDGPIVQTSSGRIEGVFREVFGQQISAFYGVPYAVPPIGSMRFARPEPPLRWKSVFKAKSQPPACVQHKSVSIELPWVSKSDPVPESEDCLKLNVWTPSHDSGNKSLPVLVWIHGGGFISGHIRSPEFDGALLSAYTNSVVAMMNYRVGVFGFLNLGDDEISGNMGMYDQVLAMQWIKKNAGSFGGDPNTVTLFGQSAGAASVGFHMLSPLSKNLFSRAILESGSPLMPISLITDQQIEETANDVLTTCGCNRSQTSRDTAACLRSVPLELLLEAQSNVIRRKDDTTFSPSFFDDFLPKHPIDAMRDGDFGVDKEVLMGFNKNEGSIFMYFANPARYPALGFKSAPAGEISLQNVYEFASRFMRSQNPIATKNLLNSLYVDVKEESIFNVTQTHVGEFFVSCPVIFAADDYAHRNLSVYFYHFTHRPKNTPWSPWIGATHFDEVQFIFGLPVAFPQSYTREEVKLSKRMMHAWSSFARTGKPEIPSYSQWPKYTTSEQSFVEFGSRSTRIRQKLPQQKCNLWKLTFEVAHSQASGDPAGETIGHAISNNQTSTTELHGKHDDYSSDAGDDEDTDLDS